MHHHCQDIITLTVLNSTRRIVAMFFILGRSMPSLVRPKIREIFVMNSDGRLRWAFNIGCQWGCLAKPVANPSGT